MKKQYFSMLSVVFLLVGLLLATSPVFGASDGKQIRLKLSTFAPAVGKTEKILQRWADMVEEKSQGRVRIDCYYGGSLAKAADTRSALELGVFDIGFVPITETASLVPGSLILEMPMMGFTGSRMATHVLSQLLKTNKSIQDEYKSVKVLIPWMANGRFIHTTKKEIRAPEDLNGLKLLAWGAAAKGLQLLGGAPMQPPPPEWYPALDRGLAEGIVIAPFMVELFKIAPVLKHHTYGVDLGYAGLMLLMNKDSWSKLPKDVQDLMENELNPWAVEEMVKIDENAQKYIQMSWAKKGHNIVKLDESEIAVWEQSLQPLHNKLIEKYTAKGVPASEILSQVKQLIAEYEE